MSEDMYMSELINEEEVTLELFATDSQSSNQVFGYCYEIETLVINDTCIFQQVSLAGLLWFFIHI